MPAMTLATITQHVATLAKANQRRLLAYKQGGGTDTRYLDGKAAAYREVAQALAAARAAPKPVYVPSEERPEERPEVPVAQLDGLIAALSCEEQQQLLRNLAWDVFGDVTDEREVLRPERGADAVDVRAVVTTLRQAFWPETYPDDDAAGDHQPAEGT